MKTSWLYGSSVALVGALGICVMLSSQSDARSFPAFLGQPQAPGDYTCFVNGGGAVVNVCTTTRRFCVTLPVEESTHAIEVTVTAPDISHNISCFGQSITRDNLNAGFTGSQSPGVFGSAQVLRLATLNTPNAGGLYACCDIAPNAVLRSFNY